jgi:hypothetical protein
MVVFYEFQADILEPLIPGEEYELSVTCDDDVTYTATRIFNQAVDIPIVSSSSFQVLRDSNGNVYFSWEIPKELLEIADSYDLEYRPYLVAKTGGVIKALLWPRAPVHINMLYLPSSVLQQLDGQGTSYSYGVHVRTSDAQNRSYSNAVVVSDLLTTVKKKNKVAVVPIF